MGNRFIYNKVSYDEGIIKSLESSFENDKKEVLELQSQINKTDKEINSMVYELYRLSDEEIKIVEGV